MHTVHAMSLLSVTLLAGFRAFSRTFGFDWFVAATTY
jgi:hypothetical protein